MIEGFKNREVVYGSAEPTLGLLPGNMQQEYRACGAITMPDLQPEPGTFERSYSSYHPYLHEDPQKTLEEYLHWLDTNDEDDEGGWI